MTLSTHQLAANLCELFIAEGRLSRLQADSAGERLYQASSLIGYAYRLRQLFAKGSRVDAVIDKTAAAFARLLMGVESYPLHRKQREADGELRFWKERLWKALPKPRWHHLCRLCEWLKIAPPSLDLLKRAHAAFRVAQVESVLWEPFPLSGFCALARGENLDDDQEEAIRRFVLVVNRAGPLIGIREVHRALETLSESRWDDGGLARLEFALYRRGCSILTERDPVHARKVEGLKAGDSVWWKGERFVLGPERPPREGIGGMAHRVFTIESDSSLVFVTGANEGLLAWEYVGGCEWAKGVPVVDRLGVEDRGLGAFYERVIPFSEAALDDLNSLVEVVRLCLREDALLAPLDPTQLGLTQKGEVRAVAALEMAPFDFFTLDDFVRRCTRGNQEAYEEVAQRSGLNQEVSAHFLLAVLQKRLRGEEVSLAHLAAHYSIADERSRKEAEERLQRLNEELGKVEREVRGRYYLPQEALPTVHGSFLAELMESRNWSRLEGWSASRLREAALQWCRAAQ